MRSCLIQLLLMVAVIFALLWFGLPFGASWLATNALRAVGFTGTDTRVEVSANLPPRILLGHARRRGAHPLRQARPLGADLLAVGEHPRLVFHRRSRQFDRHGIHVVRVLDLREALEYLSLVVSGVGQLHRFGRVT